MGIINAWYVPEKVVYTAVADSISMDDSSRISHKPTPYISASMTSMLRTHLRAFNSEAMALSYLQNKDENLPLLKPIDELIARSG